MATIHLTVNECGIEIEDRDNEGTLLDRVTGRAHDALMVLREAIAIIKIDDDAHLPQRLLLASVAALLQAAIRDIDAREHR